MVSICKRSIGSAVQNMLMVNQTLRVLNLQNCCLNDDITNCLSTGLAVNSSVKQLNLKVLTGAGAAHIFESLKYNTSLEELELTSYSDDMEYYIFAHSLLGDAVEGDRDALGCVVEEMLTVNQTLKSLNLQKYSLNIMIIDHMSAALAKNSSINRLVLKA